MLQPNFRKVAFVFDRSISIAFKSGLYGGRYVPRGCNWGAPYFNSRPSTRGDASRHRRNERADISIHAPPRGATHPGHKVVSVGAISIHAPPRGATDGSAPSCRILKFQFTPLREGRLAQAELSRANQQFQFPPLREGRRFQHQRPLLLRNFNSRPSARGDFAGGIRRIISTISIPAPPRGATPNSLRASAMLLFQFPPLREGRRKETHPVRFGRFYFNSRPSARGDLRIRGKWRS